YGGIAAVSWHWSVPLEKGSSDAAFYVESANPVFTTFSISKALEEGTWENEVLMADIDYIAEQLKKLKDADVPILWRPLHEAEGAWFWWGAEGPENCKKLYRLLYDKLTNEYGINNLIWQWTSSTSPSADEWYPGDDVVDMVTYDKYNAKDGLPNLSSIASTFYSLVKSTEGEKIVAMSENDTIPSLENLINDKAAWLYFCPWYMNYLTSEQNNPVENLIEMYNSEYCITLDELPDLKTYPISDEPQPITTTTVKPTENKDMEGDANCDGNVDIADCVLLKCYLINSKAYAVTEKGLINSDIQDKGNGVNIQDVIMIQRKVLKITDKS
ncbi:MAG: glycoside hydrolase, partial [Ruminococcus sp.]|nr:glycoside hydrolase [Ruminococcus sp.]